MTNSTNTFSGYRIAGKAALLSTAAILLSSTAFAQSGQVAQSQTAQSGGMEEIVVTATRRAEVLSDIPISVAAFTSEQMERQGIKSFDDIIKFTPGLNLTRSGNTGANQVAIRGVSSQAGSATTGVYIDDVPIQIRNLEFSAGTLYPTVFDLERVEVLRGPQGTLFGAGSEGGTIRFIQPEPSLDEYSGYIRGEVNTVENGGSGYEVGFAHGGPIIEGKLGFRASAFFKHEAGYIDRVTGTPQIVVANGLAGPSSLEWITTGVPFENSNWENTTALRGALKLAVNDELTATLSVSYQKQYFHDQVSSFWPSASTGGDFSLPVWFAGSPTTNPALTALEAPTLDEAGARFVLPSLNLSYDNGEIAVTSITGFFDRDSHRWFDYTRGYGRGYAGIQYPRSGDRGSSSYQDFQTNWTQEVRVQSVDEGPLQWLAGGFYSRMKQFSPQWIGVNFLANVPSLFGVTGASPPFGPGSTAFLNYFGAPVGANSMVYQTYARTTDKQYAFFGEASYDVTDQLKVTGGLRYSKNKFHFSSLYEGAENVLNAPAGSAVPLPFVPEYASGTVDDKDGVFTPKATVSYNVTEDAMVYATASKGFRQGGGQLKVPGVCAEGLDLLGYDDQPLSYGSDTLWSYEAGTKSSMFGGKLFVDGSAYYLKWKDVQQRIGVPICGYAFVDNLVGATSKGFDISINANPVEGVTIGTAIGYNKPTLDETIPSPTGGLPLFYAGQYIVNSGAPWTVHLYGQYDFVIAGDKEVYVRADYSYASSLYATGSRDPQSRSYVPPLGRVKETHLVNTRFGTTVSDVEVSLFINNLLNAQPHLSLSHGRNDSLWTDSTFRPRTIGVTASYRY